MEADPRGAQVLLPPRETVRFETSPGSIADLAAAFSMRFEAGSVHAVRALADATEPLLSDLDHHGMATVPHIGRFSRSGENLSFEPAEELLMAVNGSYLGLKPVGAPAMAAFAVGPTDIDRVLDDLLADETESGLRQGSGPDGPGNAAPDPLRADSDWEDDDDEWVVPLAANPFLDEGRTILTKRGIMDAQPDLQLSEAVVLDETAGTNAALLEEEVDPFAVEVGGEADRERFDFARPMTMDRPAVAGAAPARRRRMGAWLALAALPLLAIAAVWIWFAQQKRGEQLAEVSRPSSALDDSMSLATLTGSDSTGFADVQYLPDTPPPDAFVGVAAITDLAAAPTALVPEPEGGTSTTRAGGGTARSVQAQTSRADSGPEAAGSASATRGPSSRPVAPRRARPTTTADAPPRSNVDVAPPTNTAILPPQIGGLSDALKASLSGSERIPLGTGYSWVVLSTPSRDEAAGVAARFGTSGYRTRVAGTTKDGRLFFRVLIGHFGSRDEAYALRPRIAPQASGDTWLLDLGSN